MFRPQNDEPTLSDRLDRYSLVKRIGDVIATCDPPLVLGIHGDWGAGKTSFLHQLHWYLSGECPQRSQGEVDEKKCPCLAEQQADDLTVIWFEAWRYQYEKVPVVALLQEIRTQLPWYSKALNQTKKLGEVSIRSALLSLDDLTKKIGIQASTVRTIQETGERWEQENLATALPAHVIRQHLDHALGQLLGRDAGTSKGGGGPPGGGNAWPRLVVLVDDLDRCEPDAAYQLLEGIKIYLNLPSCVFVLGMNQWIIERAIAKHLKAEESGEIRHLVAREYLEKLCQDIWHLPVPSDPAAFLEPLLPFNPARSSVCAVIREFRCLPANPRKIKAFANALGRLMTQLHYTAPLPGDGTEDRRHAQMIVAVSCLYQFHPELYRLIEAYPRFYEQLRLWATDRPIEFAHPEFDAKKLQRSRVRPASATTSDTGATSAAALIETYPDPVRGNVLRVQFLIESLGPVPESDVRRYLFQ